ncbi:M20/M25/M40 family metallo-hydrolase [Streptomyces sp. NPDC056190]|uniref:M20/M25/M40 family metallo-hydrolase n=1 Tax=Streptomyces sp. NPDC056190 TaxID=3345741 RepID=UPI0035DE5C91
MTASEHTTDATGPVPTGTALRDALWARIDERADEFLSWLVELAAQPSISVTGEGVRECAALLTDILKRIGVDSETLETGGSPIVWATLGEHAAEDTPHLLIYGHYDVVPAGDPADWPFPPFEPTVHDGALWGRGVGDSKGQLLAHLCALAVWTDVTGAPPPLRLDLMLDGEDETGSLNTRRFIAEHPERFTADALYTSDASTLGLWQPALFLGVRGALYLEFTCEGSPQEWHSASYGGILPNPADRLTRALASLTDTDGRILVDGFHDGIEPVPESVRSAAAALPGTFLPPAQDLGVRAYTTSDPVDAMFFSPRICVCGIEAGYTGEGLKMAVPTRATAKVDIALMPGQSPARTAQLIRRHLDDHGWDDITFTVLADCPPSSIPDTHPLVTTARAALGAVWGQEAAVIPSIGGGGVFGAFVEHAGLPCLLVPYGQPDLQEHSSQEHFSLEWFRNGIKTSAEVLRRLSEGEAAGWTRRVPSKGAR